MEWSSLFDISLDRANQLYTWGWRLSAFGAVITMIGIAALWWGTRVRDHDSESKMAATIVAAGQANMRAATLEKEAAQLRLDLERERAARVPRNISPEQRTTLLALLKSGPKGTVRMRPKMWDPEAEQFSKQIASVLREAGFDVKDESTVSYGILGAFLVPLHVRK